MTASTHWRRALWVSVAAMLALVGLWDGRTVLLGSQPAARAVALPTPGPFPSAVSVVATGAIVERSGQEVSAGNGLATVDLDLVHGRLALRWPTTMHLPAATLTGATVSLQLHGVMGSGPAGSVQAMDYAHHTVDTAPFSDAQGSGLLITFRHDDLRFPPLQQRIWLYRGSPALVVSASVGSNDGQTLDVERFDALNVTGASSITVPGNTNPLVLAINGLTADHMPRQFVPLAALPMQAPLPYLTTLDGVPGEGAMLAGALTVSNWFPAVQLQHGVAGISGLTLTNTGPVSGRLVTSEPFILGRFNNGAAALSGYAQAVAHLGAPVPRPGVSAQLGWSSWGAFEQNVNQTRVRRNTDFMAAHLRSLGYTTVHIDDGWQSAYGDWTAGRGFPGGMGAMAQYIHARGLQASIWIAPFLTAPNAWPARQHPEWLLRNTDGSPVQVMVSSVTDVLDVSNPEVLDYIRSVCARIRDWGFDSVKLDFLYAGAMEGQRYRFDLNGVQAYTAAIRMVRDTLEADPHHPVYLIGVQQGFLPTGYFHAWRVGRDIESRTNADHIPTWDLVQREALAVSTFAFADGSLYGTDPDDLLLRQVRGAHNLSKDELQTYATMVALGGSVWLSGDDLPELAAQGRLGYLTNPEVLAVVREGRAGTPVDMGDQVTGPASIWNAPQAAGGTVIGLFNWGNKQRQVSVAIGDLGLQAGRAYRARDLWARADRGRFVGTITITLRPQQSVLLRLTAVG